MRFAGYAAMPSEEKCPKCGGFIPVDSPMDQCPACLMAGVFAVGGSEANKEIGNEKKAPRPQRTTASFKEPASRHGTAARTPRGKAGDEAGNTVGRYRILRRIGEGGMGTVFLAEQTLPVQRRVALKIIKPGVDTRQVFERFEAERQALAIMDHPYIAKFLDAGETEDGRPYFVMELVKGLPITAYCDRKILPIDDRIRLFVRVCRAVQHAHQKGIIHRDLKPSNIMVADQDGKPVPKVIDFGVAKALSEGAIARLGHTKGTQFVGTPAYMSPEQARIDEDIDARADIYSLGAVLYELLTGIAALQMKGIRQEEFERVLHMILVEDPLTPSLRLLNLGEKLHDVAVHRRTEPGPLTRKLRGDLDWITMMSLSKERDRRYDTAAELGEDLERHLADEPVIASPPSRVYRARKFIRRYRGVFVAGSSAAAALIVAFVASLTTYVQAGVAFGKQELATRKVSHEHDQKRVAQNEAEGLLNFALVDLRDRLAPRNQLALMEDFVEPAGDYFAGNPLDGLPDELKLARLQALLTLGDVRLSQSPPLREAAANFYRSAVAFLPDRDSLSSDPVWQAANKDIELRLGRLRRDEARWGKAIQHFKNALESLSDQTQRADIIIELAAAQHEKGDLEAAIGSVADELAIRKLRDETPENELAWADAHYRLGKWQYENGDEDKTKTSLAQAMVCYDDLLLLDGVEDAWRMAYHQCSVLLGDLEESPGAALEYYNKAQGALLASAADSIERTSKLADTFLKIGRHCEHWGADHFSEAEVAYHAALEEFESASRLEQNNNPEFHEGQIDAHLGLARIKADQGRDVSDHYQAGIALLKSQKTNIEQRQAKMREIQAFAPGTFPEDGENPKASHGNN
jgi:serine/threonine protein kinase